MTSTLQAHKRGQRYDADSVEQLIAGTLKSEKGRGWATSAEAADNLIADDPVAYHFRTREDGSCFEETEVNVTKASVGGSGGAKLAMQTAQGVRRLTPRECERLQGFPDDWTLIPGASDSKRYAALGDAVTVPVAEWIGRRLLEEAA